MPAPPIAECSRGRYRWRVRVIRITSPTAATALQIAGDELPHGRACVIVHRLGRDALTVSRSGSRTVDAARVAGERLELAVRPTGGGAVLWDEGLVALDVVLPRGDERISPDLTESYRWVGEACQRALMGLGMVGVRTIGPAAARMSDRGAPFCFAGLGPWEVTVGGRKVVGLCAARRQAGHIIQIGIPIRLDAPRIARALGAPESLLVTRAVGVGTIDPEITRHRVEDAVLRALGALA